MKLGSVNVIIPNGVRIIIGLFFIAVALMKLYPVEPLEILLVDIGISNWALSPFLIRLLIATEMLLGLLLITGILLKKTIYASAIMLVCFTIYLLYYRFILGNTDDCKCFGEFLQLGALESVAKNFILLGILYYLYYSFQKQRTFKNNRLNLISIVVLSFSLPFILNPVDIDASCNINDDKIGKRVQVELLDNMVFSENKIEVSQGKKIICFFSLTCQMCKYAMQKLAVLERDNNNKLPIYFVYWGKVETSYKLLKQVSYETKSQNIPYKFLDTDFFFQLAGAELPAIYFVQNGIIIKKNNYRDISPEEIQVFLK